MASGQPVWWRDGIEVVSMDPHEGYRSAIKASTELIGEVMIVVDPFHIVRLANAAVTKCRQRVQQATPHHRGWTNDPLYDIRKLLLMGAERLDDKAWARIHEGLRYGDPHDVFQAAWCAREFVRDVYIVEGPNEAAVALDKAIEWCTDPEASGELVTLAKTLTRWRTEILNHHTTGASNGKTEAANLTIKSVKRSGRPPASCRTRQNRVVDRKSRRRSAWSFEGHASHGTAAIGPDGVAARRFLRS